MRYLSLLFIVFSVVTSYGITTSARYALVYDVPSNTYLFEKNADKRMEPASLTKMMVAYITFQSLKSGLLKLNESFYVSKNAWKQPGSRMFLKEGSKVTVEKLLQGLLTDSGNDSAVTLAEGIGGSESDFVTMMNEQAKIMGMNHTHFMDASGLPNAHHYSTPRDMATLALRTIKDFPELYKQFYSEKYFTYNKIRQRNRNSLLFASIGADGLKTGHIKRVGYALVGSVVNSHGRRIIFVLNGIPTENKRRLEGLKFAHWALNMWNDYYFAKKDQLIPITIPVVGGSVSSATLTVQKDVLLPLKRYMLLNIKTELEAPNKLSAPLQKGQKIGTLYITERATKMTISVPVVIAQKVSRKFFLFRGWSNFLYFLGKYDE